MDSFEAREILALYRPGDTNRLDPRMAEALELARHDPQLAIWFGQHCAAHVKLPMDAAATIPSATAPAKTGQPSDADEHIIPLNKPALFMIGAAILLLLAAFLWKSFSNPPRDPFTSYRDRMARLVQRSFPVKVALTDQTLIRQYFRSNGGPYDFVMPRSLEKFPGSGAAVMTWHAQPVSMFGLNFGGNTNLYFFVINKSTFTDQPLPITNQFSRVGRLMTASWSGSNYVYLLTGPNDTTTLQNLLAQQP
jgi:hypothetical protein